MTRRHLLAANGSSAGPPTDPTDPESAAMPSGYSDAFPATFAYERVYRVGPVDRDYTTVEAAMTAAVGRADTSQWALIAVDSGTYPESIPNTVKLSNRTVLAAADGAGTVTMTSSTDHIFWTTGHHMIAGINFEQAGTGYCLHLETSTGHFGFMEQCGFTAPGTVLGSDVYDDGRLYLRDCVLDKTDVGTIATNIHGGPDNTIAATVAYLDCTSNKAVSYASNRADISDDALHVHGGSIESVRAEGCELYIDPDIPATLVDATRTDSTTWPTLPVGGVLA